MDKPAFLNTEIAVIRGWRRDSMGEWLSPGAALGTYGIWQLPDWAGSMKDAWELVEEMRAAGHYVCIEHTLLDVDDHDAWIARFSSVTAQAETAPAAICKAWIDMMEPQS